MSDRGGFPYLRRFLSDYEVDIWRGISYDDAMIQECVHNDQQREFLLGIAPLFWWMSPENVLELDLDAIVETVLNYGTEAEVSQLFRLYGVEAVAHIFKERAYQVRSNYFPPVRHFFNLYFSRHVPQYSN